MAEVKNYQEVVDIASKHLGKVGGDGYKDTYSPELLVKVPRYLNREGYGLTSDSFVGVIHGTVMKYLLLLQKDYQFQEC